RSDVERFVAARQPLDWAVAGELAVATGCALTAALFVWLLFSALLEGGVVPGETDEVACLAFGGAALLFAVMLLAGSPLPGGADVSAAQSLPAWLASYLVVHVERHRWGRAAQGRMTEVRAAARLMALGAVHDQLLSRVATPIVPANDEWMR